jgi:CDGSH-type Zn-finger protein
MSKPKAEVRVVVAKDGPYLVTGNIPLSKQTIGTDAEGGSEKWIEEASVATREKYSLCRCGHSKNKPFCDGTHSKVGFDGTETASREPHLDQARAFEGSVLMLTDTESLCAFGRFCDPHGSVWQQMRSTGDPKIKAMVIEQVQNCSAGRLVIWNRATSEPLEKEFPVSIGLVDDPAQECSGPLWLRGGIAVVAADGFEYESRNRVTLCRCGQSKNKPFCDGTHASIKLKDA